jgi:hypothetical protein
MADVEGGDSMRARPMPWDAAVDLVSEWENEVPEVTLWELLWAVSEVADDEREVVATVAHMLSSGSVRVVGDPRDRRVRLTH